MHYTQASLVLRFAKISSRYHKIKRITIVKLRVATKMSRKATPYQLGHGLMYAIKVVLIASNDNVTCRCKFCVYKGCDEVEVDVASRKRKQRSNILYFTKSFLPSKYHNHHVGQHGASWTLYRSLSITENKAYFDDKIKHTNTLHVHMDLAMDTLKFVISKSIAKMIIDNLFFQDDKQLDKCSSNNSDDDMDVANAIAHKAAKKANQKTNAMRLCD